MEFLLEEEKVGISYDKKTRSYGINIIGSSAIQKISYCPWCNSKLPSDLTDKFFSELSCAINKEATLFDIDLSPAEFKTDEWWKKRGL